MTDETKAKIRELVDYLDNIMEQTPSRKIADISNYLEEVLQNG